MHKIDTLTETACSLYRINNDCIWLIIPSSFIRITWRRIVRRVPMPMACAGSCRISFLRAGSQRERQTSGQPVPFRVSDPRVFALHKAWLSQQSVREPLKRQRDLAQAREVAHMVQEYMPHFDFDEALTFLHGDVRAMWEILNILNI
ncbi:MAG: hypothetical protein HY272_11460 [Gammaproteobacteria bacterium]|nr:hypothetical protein [Gammaproteobacteria bacterium]